MESQNSIVFIDELHTLVGAGSAEGSLDAANIFEARASARRDTVHWRKQRGRIRKSVRKTARWSAASSRESFPRRTKNKPCR